MSFKIPDTPEELFRQGSAKFHHLNQWLPSLFLLIIVVLTGMTSFYSVETDEMGVIRRFGKYVRTTSPGLHLKLPLNIEKVDKVAVTRVFKEEFGFRTVEPGVVTRYSTDSFDEESLMLTGDLNVIDVAWIVQFKIKDPVQLLFNVKDPRVTVRDLSESVMRQVIGDSSVTEVLTTRKNEISLAVQQKLQEVLDSYQAGIHIDKVALQDVNPPNKVKTSFNEVNEAEQEREKVTNQAWEAYNKAIPSAKGQAEKMIREAEGYALARVNMAQGDAEKFFATWSAYKNAKEVTRRRLYLETLEEILPKAGNVYVLEPNTTNILPLLHLKEGTK